MKYRPVLALFLLLACPGFSGLANAASSDYGYLWGILQQEGSNPLALAHGVVYVMSGEQKYYAFTGDGVNGTRGSYSMKLPVGTYSVYAQYEENGIIRQSPIKATINVVGVNSQRDANPLSISMPMSPSMAYPVPAKIPVTYSNTVNGTVTYQDGSGIPGVTVSLWQAADNGTGTSTKKADTTTNCDGYYQFNDVMVTSDPPDNAVIYGRKEFRVSASYADPQGIVHTRNSSFPLYHPNVILGVGQSEVAARNVTADLKIDYSRNGWLNIQSNPAGAKVFIDNEALIGPDGNQLITPCTAYIPAGTHTIKLSSPGHVDQAYQVSMAENQRTQDLYAYLQKSQTPGVSLPNVPWIFLAIVALLVLVVLLLGVVIAIILLKRN